MALLAKFDSENMVVDEALSVYYTRRWVPMEWERENKSGKGYWEVTRRATKKYSFIGMDYATAVACAMVKRAQFTRAVYSLTSNSSNGESGESGGTGTGNLPTQTTTITSVAEVAAKHEDGDAWRVDIDVSECDVAIYLSASMNVAPDTLFPALSSRNYDETDVATSLLQITSVSCDSETFLATCQYRCLVPGFSYDQVDGSYRSSEDNEWYGGFPAASETECVIGIMGVNAVRLQYGEIISNVWEIQGFE